MPRFLPVLTVALLFVALAACRPPAYVQPTPNDPHAILKIRHIVHARGGTSYGSRVGIGEFSVDERTLENPTGDGSLIHLRVWPEPELYSVYGYSFHMEMRMVTRHRTEQQSYSCPQQQCSGGYGSSPRTCRTVYRTCTRSRQVPYQRLESVPVTDDQCTGTFPLHPVPGATYLLQFDYLGENQCRLSCFEQHPDGQGGFALAPCAPTALPTTARR